MHVQAVQLEENKDIVTEVGNGGRKKFKPTRLLLQKSGQNQLEVNFRTAFSPQPGKIEEFPNCQTVQGTLGIVSQRKHEERTLALLRGHGNALIYP